ncbi:MAG TPA: hypothetical protein VF345_13615 [Chthoniobacterales bacterium]
MNARETYTLLMRALTGLSKEYYKAWGDRLSRLDEQSRQYLLERISPFITQFDRSKVRTWTPIFEILNEAKGYEYLLTLECSEVSFIRRPESHTTPTTPDVRGTTAFREVLCEVKTVNFSDREISRMRTIQGPARGLPEGLKLKIEQDYDTARKQLFSSAIPVRGPVQRICYFCFNLDLSFVLADSNKELLDGYLKQIEKDCEIVQSTKWPGDE